MKVVILAGGFGTRLSEETTLLPKPLVEVAGKPIIWHIMKMYEAAGLTEFVICCGYKGELIKNYFINYFTQNYDISVDLEKNEVTFHGQPSERWKVTLVDTGLNSMTGGRLKRVESYLNNETFCLTYGDGVSNLNIRDSIKFHRSHGKKATITAVPSPGRFGILDLADHHKVVGFHEKPSNEMGWINGGFFVLDPSVFNYIANDNTVWEAEPLQELAKDNELAAYRHQGFWQPMDTLRDKRHLEELCKSGEAPWISW